MPIDDRIRAGKYAYPLEWGPFVVAGSRGNFGQRLATLITQLVRRVHDLK